ncbi:hypothetical protein SAMN05444166_6212 [Singulisphaera sp. GP187]|uniref:HEAT repeat domain-containing protein n=1 Tax=Singulisphaera sp. GP187 TaxID=1882752 RepID=UPI000926BAD4|nr:HEAT repeat domain-containing protein [Singulisphaera sp. GP187]SIO59938.1 hypothetical protein SAMN05444166_6212 [Singulisphaera sp. GP187]
MRLTLRTLLAWLDDTLSPAEVREIGKQVAESPFAKELVERVHRVTRQRRLTVPSRSGPDSTDPNLVASYLDNELPPEEVAEFEKRCLTSDVHLAEVASVHQILSLIGQKAKVPTEARHRMYHLIKGRESVAPKAPRASLASEPEPVSEPIQPWITPEPPRQQWYGRVLPAAAVMLLIVLLCWSAWMSLPPPEVSPSPDAGPIAQGPGVDDGKLALNKPKNEAPVPPTDLKKGAEDLGKEATKSSLTEPGKVATKDVEGAAAEPTEDAMVKPELPTGTLGKAEKPTGILLRYDPDRREWDQLTAETPLKDKNRLLNLAQLRSVLELGATKVDLVGETDLTVLPAAAKQAGRLELAQGRVVLLGAMPAAPFAIQLGKKTIEITPPPGALVGVERVNHRGSGALVASDPTLQIYANEGEVALQSDDAKETLSGPGSITFDSEGTWTGVDKTPPPGWVTESKASPYDLQVGEQLQRYFRPGRSVLANLVEALEDDQKDVRRLAISATRSAGGIALIVPLLHQEENPVSRRAAIQVLRSHLGEGSDASRELHSQLESTFGAEVAERVEKLLVGFTPKEAGDEATYKKLVDDLSSPEVAVRELALETLQSLTGRDELGYDPDHPTGKGLTAWKNLSNAHELRAVGTPQPANEKSVTPKVEK